MENEIEAEGANNSSDLDDKDRISEESSYMYVLDTHKRII